MGNVRKKRPVNKNSKNKKQVQEVTYRKNNNTEYEKIKSENNRKVLEQERIRKRQIEKGYTNKPSSISQSTYAQTRIRQHQYEIQASLNRLERIGDTDNQLRRWNRETRIQNDERKVLVDEIMKELNSKNHKKNIQKPRLPEPMTSSRAIQKYANEQYRIQQNKRYISKDQYIKLREAEAQYKRDKAVEAIRDANIRLSNTPKTTNHQMQQNSKKIEEPKKNSYIKTNGMSSNDFLKKTISRFKRIIGIKKYDKAIVTKPSQTIGSNIDITVGNNGIKITQSKAIEKRASFADTLHAKVDEKKAQESLKNKTKTKSNYDSRYL